MAEEADAFWIAAPGRGEIRRERLGERQADQVEVEALYSGISRGTETLVFDGRVPSSEWTRMRAPFQAGEFPAPVKYGYASVGRVVSGPDPLRGQTVFVLYPHQTRYRVPLSAVHVVPPGVPASRAVLAANLETALTGLWDAQPRFGDRAVVIGGGTVGCLVAWLLGRVPGCEVVLSDINPRRAPVARALGVGFSAPEQLAGDADLVVHASASADGLNQAIRVAGQEATVVELSWFGDTVAPLVLGGAFHSKRLTIRSSQVGHIPPLQRPRWDPSRRMALALRLLSDPALDALISGESAFSSLPAVMADLAANPGDALCHRIRYE
jgi:hypothetical protein